MRKVTILLLVFVLIALPRIGAAQNKVGTTAAPFLTIGIGSRAQAMGGAFTAMADDASSLYWNPAGIARLEKSEVTLVHSNWLASMDFDYVGAVFNIGPWGAIGASATLLNAGKMEITTEQEQDGTGIFFDSYDMAAGLSYGYQFYDHFTIGGTLKYIHQQIWNETASGMGFDIGTLLITPLYDIRLGMSISNFGTKMQMDGRDLIHYYDPDDTKFGNNENVYARISTDEWKLPLTMRLGLAGEVLNTPQHRLTLAMDWVVPNDNTEYYNVGMEYVHSGWFALRSGYRGLRPALNGGDIRFREKDNGAGFTVGGGIIFDMQMYGFVVDYAYEDYERLGGVHRYSIGFRF